MKVIICGGRTFSDMAKMVDELHQFQSVYGPITHVIAGGAPGADRLADKWAMERNIPRTITPADWDKHGTAAGPMRNVRMLKEGKPQWVIAFPGTAGTRHMVKIARKAKISVHEVSPT